MRELSAQQLQQHLSTANASPDNSPILIDVRQPWEYDICKLDNSELIPMAQISSQVETLDPNRETVVICHHGVRSRMVGRFLEQAGFSHIINLSGGIDQWEKSVDTTMATY